MWTADYRCRLEYTCIACTLVVFSSLAITDEELARRLQEEEDSKAGGRRGQRKKQKFRHQTEPNSLVAIATENYRAHHNSSPPQWGPKGAVTSSPQTVGGLESIINEQMAWKVHGDEVVRMKDVF